MWQDVKNLYHLVVAILANVWFGFPSRDIRVIGVTGTDGKTTTVSMIYHVLKTAGKNVSMISSIGAVINGKSFKTEFHRTTPTFFMLQSFLKKAVENGSQYMVLEVTSHAIDQYRIWSIDFSVAVLTNVTYEHLDYHKKYKNYIATKAKLLQKADIAVINSDDELYETIINSKNQIAKIITYGIKNKADITPKTFPFKTKLLGEFNTYNMLAAISTCKELGLPDLAIRKAIEKFILPIGRAEIVYDKDFIIMIDFAHTPNALANVLSSVRPTIKGKLIHVFGSAGKRDKQKRPEMGKAAAEFADYIILTAEDPRGENVLTISQEILSGIPEAKQQKVSIVPDRQQAINKAIALAKKGDFVLLTGKGHERSINYGSGEEPWNEHEAVKKALRRFAPRGKFIN